MDERFNGISTTLRDGEPYWQKMRMTYNDPETGVKRRVTVSYVRNDDAPSALENALLLSAEYKPLERKLQVISELVHPQLPSLSSTWKSEVIGMEFRTQTDGLLSWRMYEDLEEVVQHVPAEKIPAHVPKIDLSELCNFERVNGPVQTVDYRGNKYALKAHDDPDQNQIFAAELFVRIKVGDVPHVATFVGVVVDIRLDGTQYVAGILMDYYARGALKWVLTNVPVEWESKWKWACQIAHGMVEIQRAGVMHGDLRCENVVIDEKGDAYIIDIVDGHGFMEGYMAIGDKLLDPSRDVFGIGVTLWEMACDGKDPIHPLTSVGSDEFDTLIRECVVDKASERVTLDYVFATARERKSCGCPASQIAQK